MADLMGADGEEGSDGEFIKDWLKSTGYSVGVFRMEASACGSPARRDRLYFVAFEDGRSDFRVGLVGVMLADMAAASVGKAFDDAYLFTQQEAALYQIPGAADGRRSRSEHNFDQVHEDTCAIQAFVVFF